MTVDELKLIENLFFYYFPLSKAKRPFNERQAIAAKRHIENHEKINGSKPAFNEKEMSEFKRLTKRRRINSFFKLPKQQRKNIKSFILAYETYYGIKLKELYLTGSFVEGHWRTSKTKNKRLLQLIYKIKGKTGFSDIDVFPVPLKGNLTVAGVQVHTNAWEKVLIFKDGKFL